MHDGAAWLRRSWVRWTVLPCAVLTAVVLALAVGSHPVHVHEIMQLPLAIAGLVPMNPERQSFLVHVVTEIRLPRVLAAVLVGASLSVSGAAYQALFRNPLVSPGLLGVLAGAAAGAAAGILADGSWLFVQACAFLAGMIAVLFGVSIAQLFGAGSLIMLILGGILSGAFFGAVLAVLKYMADPYHQLPAITYWLMGSLGQADLQDIAWAAVPMAAGIAILCLMGRALDALSMGDDEAKSLGIPVVPIRLLTIAAATLISAMTVSIAGMIGWIGLIVPHMARLLVGPGNARLLPAAACMGAIFLLAADGLARQLLHIEVPIGIVTELLGIPVFLLVLHRVRKGWA